MKTGSRKPASRPASDTPWNTGVAPDAVAAWHGHPAHAQYQEHRFPWTGQSPRRTSLAYSLIEVLIAGAILVIGISAAAILANAILVQEESNGYSLRAFNTQEQAARLWQLGLSPATITNILPERCTPNTTNPGAYSMYLGFTESTTNLGSGVTVEILNPLRIVFHSGFDRSNNLIYRTNDITVVRQTNR